MYNKNHDNKNTMLMDDYSIVGEIGKYIKHQRMRLNKTQSELSQESGINRETIARIENGANFSVVTLVRLLRHLNILEETMEAFKTHEHISPSLYIKMKGKEPKRIRHTKSQYETIKNKTN